MECPNLAKIHAFKGLIVAPFTAFKPNGEVNADIVPQYVEYLYKQGVRGAFVNGTTGEGLSLTVDERKAVAEAWVKAGKSKCEVIIVQIGANSLKDAQELARHAEKIGATGIASHPPLFYKSPTTEHLVEYYKAIASAAPTLPLMIYHIPSYTGVEVDLVDLFPKARADIPTFCGGKFTSVDVRELLRLHALPGPPFKVLSGFDEVMLPALSCGVTAFVGASYNFMAPLSLDIIEAFEKMNLEEARKLQNKVLEGILTIAKHGQGIACFKAAMNLLSPLEVGVPRLPLAPLGEKTVAHLREDLTRLEANKWARN